jgi:DNA-binding IclR family transcriptional regulator
MNGGTSRNRLRFIFLVAYNMRSFNAATQISEMSFLKKPLRKGWRNVRSNKTRNKLNAHAAGRKHGYTRTSAEDRQLMSELAPPVVKRGDYLYANCVVLAAAIFAEPWAQDWAEQLLPQARMLDWRRTQ